MTTTKLTRLLNADGEVVGYFSDYNAEAAARKEWAQYKPHVYPKGAPCRSIETPIAPAELEDVEPGDGDRTNYIYEKVLCGNEVGPIAVQWLRRGAASVEVSRYLINRWRHPGHSNRDVNLGGASEAAGVLYVLRVKAPK